MTDSALRASISDMELLAAFEAKEAKIYIDTFVNKTTQKSVYTQELRWTATDKPILKQYTGYIDCTGAVMFAPFDKDSRMKPGKFPKKGGDTLDEAKVTFATKKSGTFGALMARINDVEFPAAVKDFGNRINAKAALSEGEDAEIHRAFPFCRKKLGSPDHPVDAKKAADYLAAADWRFTIPYRFRLVEDPKTKTLKWEPQMWKVVEYHLDAAGTGVEEVQLNVNRDNITSVFAKDTIVNIQLGLGCITRQSTPGLSTYFPSFNANNNIIVEKPAPRGERKIDLPDTEKLALAKRLAASAGGATKAMLPVRADDTPYADGEGPEPDYDDMPNNGDASAQGGPPPALAPSGNDLMASLRGLADA